MYLAGPITGLDYKGATDWRDAVKYELALHGILALSPMRGKEYLASLPTIGGTPDESYMENAISQPKSIVARDRNDTQQSDLVIMNLLGAERVSIGTMIEAGWADAARVPFILVMEMGNLHNHCMLVEMAGYVVNTLEEAVDITVMFFAGRR